MENKKHNQSNRQHTADDVVSRILHCQEIYNLSDFNSCSTGLSFLLHSLSCEVAQWIPRSCIALLAPICVLGNSPFFVKNTRTPISKTAISSKAKPKITIFIVTPFSLLITRR